MIDRPTSPRPRFGLRETVYRNAYQEIYRRRVDFGTFAKTYFVIDCGARAALVVDRNGKILLTRQYRHLIDGFSHEVPGGRLDEGEDPAAGALRECREETGIICKDPKPLLVFHPGLDTLHNPTHIFCTSTVARARPQDVHHREVEGPVWAPLTECLQMIFRQEIIDSLSIIALLSYHVQQSGTFR